MPKRSQMLQRMRRMPLFPLMPLLPMSLMLGGVALSVLTYRRLRRLEEAFAGQGGQEPPGR